jgi:DNA-directed RNA polymerase specialized sigma subunit
MKVTVDKTVILDAVKENDAKPKQEQLTRKQLGEMFGVSGPRISQIAPRAKKKPEDRAEAANDESNAPEAA